MSTKHLFAERHRTLRCCDDAERWVKSEYWQSFWGWVRSELIVDDFYECDRHKGWKDNGYMAHVIFEENECQHN